MKKYDHIILGTGQATGTLLGRLIPTGDSIAVIEGAKVGGSCVNFGCTPTKTLVASAKAFHMAKKGDFYGLDAGSPTLNFDVVRERMNKIRNGGSNGLSSWMESTANVDLIREMGSFTGERTLKVGDDEIEGENIYINVGTRPFLPPIDGLADVPWMDSAGLLDLEEVPEHLLILGGGYIGAELGQVYRRFGAQVTIIQLQDRMMPREDEDVSIAIQDFLIEEGIDIRLSTVAKEFSYENDQIHLKVNGPKGEEVITASHLLVASGRKPNSDTINAEAAGLKLNNRGHIEVDDFCRTGVDGVFAVGDVNGHGAFTHTAVNDAEIVLDYLFGGDRAISKRIPIYGLFTDPPLGRVGMTERQALDSGKKVLVATRPMARIARAKEMGETKGFAKLLVDAETDLIIGASILGVGGDEVINMFAAIMHSGIPCREYRKVVLAHPTVSELMPWILDGIKEAREE